MCATSLSNAVWPVEQAVGQHLVVGADLSTGSVDLHSCAPGVYLQDAGASCGAAPPAHASSQTSRLARRRALAQQV